MKMTPGRATAQPDPEELQAVARDRLAYFTVPVDVIFVGAPLRNPSGKILRRKLV
jgi:acyl-CoA synthetase (AMP-forming)/AMP-acid ligase II